MDSEISNADTLLYGNIIFFQFETLPVYQPKQNLKYIFNPSKATINSCLRVTKPIGHIVLRMN